MRFLIFILALAFALPAFAAEQGKSTYDRVMNTKTIRCAYAVYPPTLMKDPNTGKITGIFHDLLEEVARLHNLKIDWAEEVDYGSIIQGFEAGRYDMFCAALWPGPERAQKALFTVPAYYSGVGIYVKADDKRFDGHPEKLNATAFRISVQDGDINDSIAKADFPLAQRVSIPQMAQSSLQFQNVMDGKADAIFAEASFAKGFMKEHPGALQNIVPDNPVRVFPNVYMLPKNEFQFKSMLDTVLQELLYRGYVDKLIDQYAGAQSGFYKVAKPYAAVK